eukprot:6165088-Prymnesium_polylepis.1
MTAAGRIVGGEEMQEKGPREGPRQQTVWARALAMRVAGRVLDFPYLVDKLVELRAKPVEDRHRADHA